MAINIPDETIWASDLRERGAFLGNIPDSARVTYMAIEYHHFRKLRKVSGSLEWYEGYYPTKYGSTFEFWEEC